MNCCRDIQAAIRLQEVKVVLDIDSLGPQFCGNHWDTRSHSLKDLQPRAAAHPKRDNRCNGGCIEWANIGNRTSYVNSIGGQSPDLGRWIAANDCEVQGRM